MCEEAMVRRKVTVAVEKDWAGEDGMVACVSACHRQVLELGR